jgi:hypothetical protein
MHLDRMTSRVWITVALALIAACAPRTRRPSPSDSAKPRGIAQLIVNRVGPRDSVAGVVSTDDGGAAIPGAVVSETGTTLQATTDQLGRFRMGAFAPGKHVLVTRHPSYKQRADTIDIIAGQGLSLGILLAREDTIRARVPSP